MEREADVCPGHLGRLGCVATSEHKDPAAPRPWGWNSSATWCPRGAHCPRLHCRQGLASSIPVAGSSPRWANWGRGRLGWHRAPGTTPAVPGPQGRSLDSVAAVQVALSAPSPAQHLAQGSQHLWGLCTSRGVGRCQGVMPKGEAELKIKLSCSGATFPSPDYSWMKFQLLGTQHSPELGMEPRVWQGPMGCGACGGAGGTRGMDRREGGKDTGARGGGKAKRTRAARNGDKCRDRGREGRGMQRHRDGYRGAKGMDAGGTKGVG